MPNPVTPEVLAEHGLILAASSGVVGSLVFERPAWLFGHRLKHCTVGAFSFWNASGHTAAYRTHFGRYTQIGESSIIGPPEHPTDWFSSHPFAFGRPGYLPSMYQVPDFARLAPDAQDGPSFADTTPNDTWIDHEAYVGAGSFVKRGVRIGIGAVVGARSVVTRDIPPYAIAVGSPAKVIRMRFSDAVIDRMQTLAWWHYDLAPFKAQVNWADVEGTLAFLEQRKRDGTLHRLVPDTYTLTRDADQLQIARRDTPLFPTNDPTPCPRPTT